MAIYKRRRYLLMTTDPVHIGTGGYRLGRVDNSIVREPGTRVPKIPGTSLHGAARSYAAQLYQTPEAAGQSQDKLPEPDKNPVCYTFGYINKAKDNEDEETRAYSGVVNIFDAHILLFPVSSMVGPVWVGTAERLGDAGFTVGGMGENEGGDKAFPTWDRKDGLNLGWLMLDCGNKITLTPPEKWKNEKRWQALQDRVVLVRDALFSQIVNSNLEVRTSVAIDPETGAAKDQALFTYEALPRAVLLTVEVVLDDYRRQESEWPLGKIEKTPKGEPLPGPPWQDPLDTVAAGLRMIEWLGVGGMGTRGFGRMVIVGEPLEQTYGEEAWR